MVKYACKVPSSRCLSQSFTAVHEDIPKCMPEERLHTEPVKLDMRGFKSRRASKDVSPVGLVLSFGTQKMVHEIVSDNIFYFYIRYHSAKREVLRYISQSNANGALPENGYRVISDSAKRFLSALCRRHSKFQPLLLHE